MGSTGVNILYLEKSYKQTLEKPEGGIHNGQSREIGNIGYTRHTTKTNQTKNTTQKTEMLSNKDPTTNRA